MKKKELIINDKLTPIMDRVRSGSLQLFRDTKKDDRSFINEKNCDVALKHENKEMYAELIEGKWYWVSSCRECNGEPRDSWGSYIECEKHDVCSCCGRPRKDFKESVWGGKHGWTCNSCMEIKKLQIKTEAFEKLNGEEPDTMWQDEIICPHCGSEISNDDIYESQELTCGVCEGEMELEVEYTASYTTAVKGERITE